MQSMAMIALDTYSNANKYAKHKVKAKDRNTWEMEYLKCLISMQQMALTKFERNKKEIKSLR